jgi:hypothetical protein
MDRKAMRTSPVGLGAGRVARKRVMREENGAAREVVNGWEEGLQASILSGEEAVDFTGGADELAREGFHGFKEGRVVDEGKERGVGGLEEGAVAEVDEERFLFGSGPIDEGAEVFGGGEANDGGIVGFGGHARAGGEGIGAVAGVAGIEDGAGEGGGLAASFDGEAGEETGARQGEDVDASKGREDKGSLRETEATGEGWPCSGPEDEEVWKNGDQVPLIGAGVADDEVGDEEGWADEQEDEKGSAVWGLPELP